MESKVKSLPTVFLISIMFFLIGGLQLNAQEAETLDIEPYMEFSYWKNTHNVKLLKVKMSYFTEILQKPLEGLSIQFFSGEEENILLGESKTDKKGLAMFTINSNTTIPANEEGIMYFRAEYQGEENIFPASEEVYAKDVKLDMDLIQHEGIRMIKLNATTMTEGEMVPVTDEDVYVYVPRMFSDLVVGEGYFEADGTTEIEFPSDIPGDSLGNIVVVARFNDHYLYGNVEKRENVPWGVPSYHEGPGDVRTLWTQVAPKWMIITLSIMLAGVWGHYVYAIVSIIRIRKNGKNEKNENK